MKIAFVLIGIIFVLVGVVSIYDARKITIKFFSFQDVNEGAKTLKIFGFVIAILGLGVIYFYLPEIAEILKSRI